MSIDFEQLWGGIKNSVENAFDDVIKVGVPALTAAAQKQGIDALNQMYRNTQNTLQNNVKEIIQRPSEEGSFAATLTDELKTPVLKEYWPKILLGAAVLVGIGLAWRSKNV